MDFSNFYSRGIITMTVLKHVSYTCARVYLDLGVGLLVRRVCRCRHLFTAQGSVLFCFV